jgi:glycosyltransferase involved in cell wall biosynthesis
MVSNYGWTLFNFRKRLITELADHGLEVFVQTEFDGYEQRLALPAARVLPLEIDRKGINPFRDALTVFSVLGAIKKIKPAACLFFTIKPIVYGGVACRIARIPYVSNVTGLGTAFIGRRWIRSVAVFLYRVGLRSAARVFFQNRTDLELFISEGMVRPEQAALLPGSGVNLTRFATAPYPQREEVRFLLIARMLWDKGVGEFIDAARIVKKANVRARFQLLGPVDAVNRTAVPRDKIDNWVREGLVEYLGETDDVRPFIAAADCIVLPSYREGAPRSLLEAAAMGRPVITSDSIGCRHVVEDRRTALVCRVRDSKDLADKMMEMLSFSPVERADIGLKGREKMEREYDEKVVIQRYIETVRALVGT